MFADRSEAGQLLAEKLKAYRGADAVVLAIPRGGIVTGYEIAHALRLPLDIVVTRKIAHPLSPEYAIGAVDEYGKRILNTAGAATDADWLATETARQKQEAERRGSLYRGGRSPVAIAGKTVILTDDGLATGLTMQLAVRRVKKEKPKRIIVAIPAAPEEALRKIRTEGADVIITLLPPEAFLGAVGAHYQHFEQVEDNDAIWLLNQAHEEDGANA